MAAKNIFDDTSSPPAVALAPSAVIQQAPPVASVAQAVSQPAVSGAQAPVTRRGRGCLNFWFLYMLLPGWILLLVGAIALGSLGMWYPGSFLIDPIFGSLGQWFFMTAAKSDLVSSGYLLVFWSVVLVAVTWVTAKARR